MATLENVFSWSKSRAETFRECQRKYYYDKYGCWGGWDAAAAPRVRLTYVLKNLKNRWAWKGETVHHIIEEVLKSLRQGRPIPKDEALGRLTETMRRDFRSSKAKKNYQDPKRNLGLFEHEYGKPMNDEAWKKVHDEAHACLANFYGSALYAELLADDKKSWLVIEDLEEFDFNGCKIFVKLDFARKKNGVIEIYDWKTGKSDKEASVQMGAYSLYAMGKWRVPLSDIRTYLFNVAAEAPVPVEQPLTERLLEETKAEISRSIADMKSLLSDSAKNIPKAPEHFHFTENERACGFCNFYKVCERFQPDHKS